jgi:hypothetical protein
MFSKNIRTVYLYTVCFITLMMMIGGIISTVNAVANYYLPQTWHHWGYARPLPIDSEDIEVDLTGEEIAEREEWEREMEDQRAIQEENERIRNLRNIFSSSAVWLIATPIFILHWRLIKKETNK